MYLKKRVKLLALIIFRLPSTILHELLHALVAVLFSCRIVKFDIWPKFDDDRIWLGSVIYMARYEVVVIFVSLAPLLSWAVLTGIYQYTNVAIKGEWLDLLKIYGIYTLLVAGLPSIFDLKQAFRGLFSVSGISLVLLIGIIFIIFTQYSHFF